jgi:hypothetical protein
MATATFGGVVPRGKNELHRLRLHRLEQEGSANENRVTAALHTESRVTERTLEVIELLSVIELLRLGLSRMRLLQLRGKRLGRPRQGISNELWIGSVAMVVGMHATPVAIATKTGYTGMVRGNEWHQRQ